MSKILVLAEKPSVGKEIARVLGCKKSGNGCMSGEKYIVTWALGHLVTLCDPEHYGAQYKTWSMETLPMLPPKMDLEVIPQTAKQYSTVKRLLHSPEVSSLVIATDAGREGELVARWILEKAGFRKPVKRLWISSQTDKAIREGFVNLKDGRDYDNLYRSAQARAEADWLVGLNVTRALTCKFNAQLSAGRVQTPTLAIIAEREREIRGFVPKDYYTINADLGKLFVTYKDSKNQSSLFDKTKAEEIAKQIRNQEFRLTDLQGTEKRTPPPALYDLTELQRDANKLYGFSPKQTLNLMQRLYEQHKALTYPRTDSRYLTDDIVPTLPDRLRAVSLGEYAPLVSEIFRSKRSISKSCVNNAKVTDHHAIIPTEQKISLADLNAEEKKIYHLVVKRFLTSFFPAYEYRRIRAEFRSGSLSFYAAGREVVAPGWKKVYQMEDEDLDENEQTLPSLRQGDCFRCEGVLVKAHKTKAPARYTEATLLSAMENPSRFIADKQMKEYIGGGLGTPATRADIMEKLFSSFYIEKQGSSIIPTSKGLQLIELVPPDLKEPLLTAKWEQELEAISRGKAKKDSFLAGIRDYAAALVQTVQNSNAVYRHDNLTRKPCPECGKMMLEVNGKHGKMLVCQDRECGYRQNISRKTNVRCPECHKVMDLYGEGENKRYVCSCGFREKADRFHQKLKERSGASKQDVRRYLQQQSKQDDHNDIFAAALEKAIQKKKK